MNDPTIVFVGKILAIFVGEALASLIAPQLVIVVGGLAGAYFGLGDWRKSTRLEAFGYVLSFGLMGWLFAGSAAALLVAYGPEKLTQYQQFLLSPCAVGIGWVGHRWPRVFAWVLRREQRRAEQ